MHCTLFNRWHKFHTTARGVHLHKRKIYNNRFVNPVIKINLFVLNLSMCGLLSCGLFDYIIFYIQISGDFTFLLHFKLGVNGGLPDFHGWLNTGIAHWLRGPGSSNILL